MSYSPVHRLYSTVYKRLRSFDTWPRGLTQKPQEMAEAGFFYTGCDDRVICFFCDGRLKDWTTEDQPWIEHARWFQSCPYVLVMKGKDYVKGIINDIYNEVNENCKQNPLDAQHLIVNKSSSLICKICLGVELDTCFLPCGHAVACAKCAFSIGDKCPICRKVYTNITRLYF